MSVGCEVTANYHSAFVYHLQQADFKTSLLSSSASARTREAWHNSWDNNDPKDAQVILYLLKSGCTQIYFDPLINSFNDTQELAKTYRQISQA